MRAASVLELLLLDDENPRSLAAALATLDEQLRALPESSGSTRAERLLEDLGAELDRIDVSVLATVDGETRPHLVRLLSVLAGHLSRFADAVAEVHLTGTPVPRRYGLQPGPVH